MVSCKRADIGECVKGCQGSVCEAQYMYLYHINGWFRETFLG